MTNNASLEYTADQIALMEHIQAANAKTQAWVDEDPNNRWAGMVVDDPWHWAGYDIYTVAQYEHYMAACDNFEMTRALYGFKPNWGKYEGMTVEEIEADTDKLSAQLQAEREADEREAEELAAKLDTDVETLKRWGVV